MSVFSGDYSSAFIAGASLLVFSILLAWGLSKRTYPERVGPLPIAVLVFGFLYLAQPLYLLAVGDLKTFLSAVAVFKGLLVSACMLAALTAGWALNRNPRQPLHPKTIDWAHYYGMGAALSGCGMVTYVLLVIFSGGVREFFGHQHLSGATYAVQTAYIYLSPWWVIAGLAVMLTARASTSVRLPRLPVYGSCIFLYGLSLAMSSRGYLYGVSATLFLAPALARRSLSRTRLLVFLLVIALAVALVFGFRAVLFVGSDLAAAPSLNDALLRMLHTSSPERHLTSSEFVYHCALIETVDEQHKYNYGAQWLFLATAHIIPRLVWPSKPTFVNVGGVDWNDIEATTGIIIAPGSAPGAVAEAYSNFGWFSVALFFMVGMASQKGLGVVLRNPALIPVYTVWYAVSLNLYAQGIAATIVPFLYSTVPIIVYLKYFRRQHRQHPRM